MFEHKQKQGTLHVVAETPALRLAGLIPAYAEHIPSLQCFDGRTAVYWEWAYV